MAEDENETFLNNMDSSDDIGETSDGRVKTCLYHRVKDFIGPGQGQVAVYK
jgi:hypothetical protein